MSNLLPTVAMRKNVPRSMNLVDNDVGRVMKQETKQARRTMEQRLDSNQAREEQRLNQRISETIRIDVIA